MSTVSGELGHGISATRRIGDEVSRIDTGTTSELPNYIPAYSKTSVSIQNKEIQHSSSSQTDHWSIRQGVKTLIQNFGALSIALKSQSVEDVLHEKLNVLFTLESLWGFHRIRNEHWKQLISILIAFFKASDHLSWSEELVDALAATTTVLENSSPSLDEVVDCLANIEATGASVFGIGSE